MNRSLVNGASTLQYNLYTTRRTQRCGATVPVQQGLFSDNALLIVGNNTNTYTVYGRIPPLQDVRKGNYSDSIVVTINY